MRIVQYSLKELIVIVLQQLIEVWHVRWAEAASLAAAEKFRYNWHSAGSLGWPFPMLKYKYIFK